MDKGHKRTGPQGLIHWARRANDLDRVPFWGYGAHGDGRFPFGMRGPGVKEGLPPHPGDILADILTTVATLFGNYSRSLWHEYQ
jgi:hypothetical protein